MADMAPVTGATQRSSVDILKSIDDQVKNLSGGNSEKVKEMYKNVVDILSGDNVKVSRGATTGVDGNRDTSKTGGTNGVPVLDSPDDAKAKEADLTKLIAFLQLDNEERQTAMAKSRIDVQKANLDTEHKDRMKEIDKSIQKMKDAEKASKLSRIFGWIGAALAVVAAVVLTVVTGGVAAGFAIAGAVLAIGALTMNETGATDKLVEKLTEHMQEKYGWSKDKAQLFASLVVNLSIMVLQLGCSVGSMVGGAMAAAKAAADVAKVSADAANTAANVGNAAANVGNAAANVGNAASHTAKTVQYVVTIANTTVSAGSLGVNGVSTYLTHRSENAKADTTELEKFITMLQQRLEESQEELQQLLQQIESGVGKIAELISSSTDTSEQIAQNLGQMA